MAKPITYQVVKGARDIIADPSHWCQMSFAEDADGVPALLMDGVKFCAAGALHHVAYHLVGGGDVGDDLAANAMEGVSEANDGVDIVDVNDGDGHQAVIDLFDRYLATADGKVEAA